jgi:hypothetical protein
VEVEPLLLASQMAAASRLTITDTIAIPRQPIRVCSYIQGPQQIEKRNDEKVAFCRRREVRVASGAS